MVVPLKMLASSPKYRSGGHSYKKHASRVGVLSKVLLFASVLVSIIGMVSSKEANLVAKRGIKTPANEMPDLRLILVGIVIGAGLVLMLVKKTLADIGSAVFSLAILCAVSTGVLIAFALNNAGENSKILKFGFGILDAGGNTAYAVVGYFGFSNNNGNEKIK